MRRQRQRKTNCDNYHECVLCGVPVAQTVEHGSSNIKVMSILISILLIYLAFGNLSLLYNLY